MSVLDLLLESFPLLNKDIFRLDEFEVNLPLEESSLSMPSRKRKVRLSDVRTNKRTKNEPLYGRRKSSAEDAHMEMG